MRFRRRGGDPQDQARRGDHAGEPVVRLVLRDVSGRGRDTDDERAVRPCACPTRPASAIDRSTTPPTSTAARAQQRRGRHGHQRRPDERVPDSAATEPGDACRRRTRVHREQYAGRAWGITTPGRSRTTGPTRTSYVLHDQLFEPVASWSLPDHNYLVSAWSALCSTPTEPSSCTNNIVGPYAPPPDATLRQPSRRDRYRSGVLGVDRYHLPAPHPPRELGVLRRDRQQPDCEDGAATCPLKAQSYKTPGIWNPLPIFTDVQQDHQLPTSVRPPRSAGDDGHPPGGVVDDPQPDQLRAPTRKRAPRPGLGDEPDQHIMRSPDWKSTAIFLSWDDWGGFYDHVDRPRRR